MIRRSLDEVAATVGGTVHGDPADVSSVATDSRQLTPGALFVALRGDHADGHAFVGAAAAAGAAAALVEREVPDVALAQVVVPDVHQALRALAVDERRRIAPRTLAVTGSVGKTTVKDLTAAAIGTQRRVHAARGSFNNELGVPLTLLGMAADTEVVVAEIGARHVGDIADLAPLVAPEVSIVTAVAAVHLEIFGSIDAVATAKAELVEALGPDGLAILHVGDPRVAAMASRAPAVLGVALQPQADADVWAEDLELDALGRARATAVTPWGRAPFSLPVTGRHQTLNALLALAAAGHLGVDVGVAAEALARAPVSPGRGEVVELGDLVLLDDAYNASPASVLAALDTLVHIDRPGPRWAVLGEMAELGPTADEDHAAVGVRVAELGVDHLVVVGERASGLSVGARSARSRLQVHEVPDVTAAIDLLRARLGTVGVVLVKASRIAGLDPVAAALRADRAANEETST